MQANFRELKIWKFSMDLVPEIYKVIALLPVEESNNLKDQMRRAVTSLPLNIAEGASSKSLKMYLSHLNYAYASAQELSVALMLCFKIGYLSDVQFHKIFDRVDRFNRASYKFLINLEQKELKEKLDF